MNEEQFHTSLCKSFDSECNHISQLDIPEYQTSEKFQHKMSKMLKKKRSVSPIPKRLATVCAIAIFACGTFAGMTACAFSSPLHAFIVAIFDGGQQISANPDETADDIIMTKYLPTAIPEGYTATVVPSPNMSMYSCMQEYSDGTNHIFFGQYVKSIYTDVDFAPSSSEYYLDKNGQEYLIADFDGTCVIVWDNGDYILHMYSSLGREETLALCRSVKKNSE